MRVPLHKEHQQDPREVEGPANGSGGDGGFRDNPR
jgi:hypothetical protein